MAHWAASSLRNLAKKAVHLIELIYWSNLATIKIYKSKYKVEKSTDFTSLLILK